jgi:hypothetical protein
MLTMEQGMVIQGRNITALEITEVGTSRFDQVTSTPAPIFEPFTQSKGRGGGSCERTYSRDSRRFATSVGEARRSTL